MKLNKILIIFMAMFLILISACSSDIENAGNKIVVQTQANSWNKYKVCNEIKDSNQVQNARDILNSIKWENAQVDMAHPPEYEFHFEDTEKKTSGPVYMLWISPKKDKIELVIDSEIKYAQLNEEKSEKLFKIITDKSLKEV